MPKVDRQRLRREKALAKRNSFVRLEYNLDREKAIVKGLIQIEQTINTVTLCIQVRFTYNPDLCERRGWVGHARNP